MRSRSVGEAYSLQNRTTGDPRLIVFIGKPGQIHHVKRLLLGIWHKHQAFHFLSRHRPLKNPVSLAMLTMSIASLLYWCERCICEALEAAINF